MAFNKKILLILVLNITLCYSYQTENDMNITNRSKLFNSYSKVFIVFNGIIENGSNLSKNVSQYKQELIVGINNLIPNSKSINHFELKILLDDIKFIDVIYPGIGNNLDLIKKYTNLKNITVNYIFRDEDITYWKYANSGFNKFKNSFNKLNNNE